MWMGDTWAEAKKRELEFTAELAVRDRAGTSCKVYGVTQRDALFTCAREKGEPFNRWMSRVHALICARTDVLGSVHRRLKSKCMADCALGNRASAGWCVVVVEGAARQDVEGIKRMRYAKTQGVPPPPPPEGDEEDGDDEFCILCGDSDGDE